jgi:hypothetical protein
VGRALALAALNRMKEPPPLMSTGDRTMTALTAWQRRDRMWARVQIGCAVVIMVTLMCW